MEGSISVNEHALPIRSTDSKRRPQQLVPRRWKLEAAVRDGPAGGKAVRLIWNMQAHINRASKFSDLLVGRLSLRRFLW
jgi:hypothetical protein